MLWRMPDPSSLTRDRSPASCSVSLVSQPLDHYGSPNLILFWYGYLVVPAKSVWESILLPLWHMPSLLQIKHLDWCRSVSIMSSLFHGIVCVLSCIWLFVTPWTVVRSPPGSSIHVISQARILEQVAISFSRGSSQPRNQTHFCCISYTGRRILYHCTTWEAFHWNCLHLGLPRWLSGKEFACQCRRHSRLGFDF